MELCCSHLYNLPSFAWSNVSCSAQVMTPTLSSSSRTYGCHNDEDHFIVPKINLEMIVFNTLRTFDKGSPQHIPWCGLSLTLRNNNVSSAYCRVTRWEIASMRCQISVSDSWFKAWKVLATKRKRERDKRPWGPMSMSYLTIGLRT